MTDMNTKKVTIAGFEFEVSGIYSGYTDVERLNTYLEKKFNKFDIKDFMSRRHPELFPTHIGLRSDDNICLRLVRYTRSGLDDCGEYNRGYDVSYGNNLEKYKADILEYYSDREPDFYRFISSRIE